MSYYLAGPMRGYDRWNFPAFREACAWLRSHGMSIVSPHELDEALGFTEDTVELPDGFMPKAMRRDVEALLDVHGVILLPGWERSSGARFELSVAEMLGLKVCTYNPDSAGATRLNPIDWPDVHARIADADASLDAAASSAVWGVALPPLVERLEAERYTPAEVRVTSATGGAKGSKPARFDMIPPDVLFELAEHYGRGEAKYPSDPETGEANWQKGYAWSLSVAALQRHLYAWLAGEDDDPETGSSHLLAVVWHAIALRWWQRHGRGTDDIQGRKVEVPA